MPGTPEEMEKLDKQLEKELEKLEDKAEDLGLGKKVNFGKITSEASKLIKEVNDEPD